VEQPARFDRIFIPLPPLGGENLKTKVRLNFDVNYRIRSTARVGLFTVRGKLADPMQICSSRRLAFSPSPRLDKHRLISEQPKPPARASSTPTRASRENRPGCAAGTHERDAKKKRFYAARKAATVSADSIPLSVNPP